MGDHVDYIRFPAWRRAAAVLMLGLMTGAFAADDGSKKIIRGLQERLQRAQQGQQAAEDEKETLNTQKSQFERQARTTRAELERGRAAIKDSEQALELARAEAEKLRADKAALQTELATLGRTLVQSQEELRQKTAAANTMYSSGMQLLQTARSDLDTRSVSLMACEVLNKGLYELNLDLLGRLEKASSAVASKQVWSGSLFTRIGGVRAENESAQVRDKLEDLQLPAPVKPQ